MGPNSRGLACPGRKLSKQEQEREPQDLQDAAATLYRAQVARANFLAGDRPDIAFAVKELCRAMSRPTDRDADGLKRLARYLLDRPRVVMCFPWQTRPTSLQVFSDSDWAGCVRTRRSTSGGAVMHGAHTIKVWSHTQATVALSSAEAELIAAVKGASEGLAVRSLARDLGHECSVGVWFDSSAALGVCKRTGVGKIRHLDTRLLWIQDLVREGGLVVRKVAGEENPADLMTKHLGSDQISANLVRLRCWPREGRAEAAPRCEATDARAVVAFRSPCAVAVAARKAAGEEGCESTRSHPPHHVHF